MRTHKKTFIMMLVLCMLLAMIPAFAFAEPDTSEPGEAAVSAEGSTEITGETAEDENAEPADDQSGSEDHAEQESEDSQESSQKEEQAGSETPAAADVSDTAGSEAADEIKTKSVSTSAKTTALKAAAGSSVSYTAKRNATSNDVQFTAKINSVTCTGTCCELGVKFRSSGTATIVALAKNHLCRKVAYKYKNWQGSDTRNYDMGGVYKGACLEAMMQYAMAWEKDKSSGSGVTTHRDKVTAHMKKSSSNGGNGWPAATVNKIVAAVKALNGKTADELSIPGKFRAYWGKITNTTSGDTTYGQDAVFWGDIATGTGSVKKVPASDIADQVAADPDDYDMTGAKYQLYTDAACTKKATDVNWNNAVLTTKADGTSNTRTLEIGTYYAKEIKAANKGYGIATDDETGEPKVYTVNITKGKTTTFISEEPINDSPVPEENPDIKIEKIDLESEEGLAGAELAILDSSGVSKETWTTDDEPHIVSGLEDGTYTLCEVSAPYGYEIADDVTFKVESGAVVIEGDDTGSDQDEEIAGIILKDPPVAVETSAVSASTNSQSGARISNEKITDTVTVTGLIAGRSYRIEGTLMSKLTGSAISGAEAAKDFTATDHTMDVPVEFTLDATELEDGDSVVVYETLYRTTLLHDETAPVELGKHQNMDDDAQTVIYPSIFTSASLQNDNTEVKDIVEYENLLPDTDYVLRGWLVDTVTGEKVPESDGSTELSTGSETSGRVEVILKTEKYDEMSGRSMTAFEELYVVDDEDGEDDEDDEEKEILVAEHKDTSDSAQTVAICQDLKVRKNVTGNLGDLTKVFEFTLEFTGLVPESPYMIEGDDEKTFMADNDGNATVPVRLKDDQEAVIKGLPKGATYRVTEADSDHVSKYRIFSEDMEKKGAKISVRTASNGAEASKMLSTAEETVDLLDGTVVVLWENNRDLATLTGISGPDYSAYAAVLAALGLAIAMIIGNQTFRSRSKPL